MEQARGHPCRESLLLVLLLGPDPRPLNLTLEHLQPLPSTRSSGCVHRQENDYSGNSSPASSPRPSVGCLAPYLTPTLRSWGGMRH